MHPARILAAALLLPVLSGCHSTVVRSVHAHLTDPCQAVSNAEMSRLLGAPVTGVPKGSGTVPPCEWRTRSGAHRSALLYTYRYDDTFSAALHLIDSGSVRRVAVHVPGADEAVGRVYDEPDHRDLVVAMRGRQLALAFVTGVDDTDGLRIARDTTSLLLERSDPTSSASS